MVTTWAECNEHITYKSLRCFLFFSFVFFSSAICIMQLLRPVHAYMDLRLSPALASNLKTSTHNSTLVVVPHDMNDAPATWSWGADRK